MLNAGFPLFRNATQRNTTQ